MRKTLSLSRASSSRRWMLRFIPATMSSPGPGHQFRYDSVDLSLVRDSGGPPSTSTTPPPPPPHPRGDASPTAPDHPPPHPPPPRQVGPQRPPRDPGSADDDLRRALAHDRLIVPQSGGPAD